MDKKTVFVKTKEGEEAMRQRTRLVQRNLRSILIMVDGQTTVAELSRRFGDKNAAEAALAELLAGGFIAEQLDQLDFTKVQPPELKKEPVEDVPELTSQITPPPAQNPLPAPPPAAEPPPLQPVIEEIELTAPEYESLPPPARPVPRPQPERAAAGAGWMGRIKTLFAKPEKPAIRPQPEKEKRKAERQEEEYEGESIGGADLEPIRRGRKFNIGWPVLALSAVVGIPVLLVLTLLLYPYGRHLPAIERNASAYLQAPVKVGDIGFSFLPRPHIALRNISVGKDEAPLSIASVRAVPDFFSLLGERKVFHELTFSKIAVKDAGLGKLALAAAGSPPAEIRHISLRELSLAAGDARLGGLNGEIKMTASGTVETIQLSNSDASLKVDLQPQGEAYRVAATGNNWTSPFNPKLTFQWLEVQGELRPASLALGKIDGRAYEGLVEGKALLGWSGGATLSSDLELKRLSADKLLTALGSALSAEGELSARLKLAAKAGSLGKLAEALHVDGTFEMKRGTAKGFDLGEAVRNTGRGPTRGGETKFEQLSGTVDVDPKDCRLGNLHLVSGLLTAGGSVGIARSGSLGGAVNVELKSSAATLRVPLAVGGTTKDPMLTPSRR
ncbi:MAG: AsmA-like C-terminal region-containing protein [Denitratisoma sp.]|nr:AsmA-like C-terminal region-containing protein [Denitratisoma sp.]